MIRVVRKICNNSLLAFFLCINHSAVNPLKRVKPIHGDQPNSTHSIEAGCVDISTNVGGTLALYPLAFFFVFVEDEPVICLPTYNRKIPPSTEVLQRCMANPKVL